MGATFEGIDCVYDILHVDGGLGCWWALLLSGRVAPHWGGGGFLVHSFSSVEMNRILNISPAPCNVAISA